MRFAFVVVLAASLLPAVALAQGYDSHFHTGNAVVDLRTEPPAVTCPVVINAFEGTSTWSDPITGDLLFYTDGISVADATTGTYVPGGNSTLGGVATATMTSFLAPVPETLNTQLYIFSNDTDNVKVNVLDISGAPALTEINSPLLADTGEAVSGLDDEQGGFWLVVWNEAGATLDAYTVNVDGIAGVPVTSPLPWSNLTASRGTIIFPRDGSRVAVTTEDGQGLAWAGFDRETGQVTTSWETVHTRQGYSVAWSPDGTQLYYVAGSSWGWSGQLYQYDTTTGIETNLGGSGLSGVMLGADDRIWVCGYGDPVLGAVTDPDVGGAANTNLSFLSLDGCVAGYNLSNQVSLTDVLCIDEDGDGHEPARCGGTDCNDQDPDTYEGAPELCDGVDNDCDLLLPEDEEDDDGDGLLNCEDDCPDDPSPDCDGSVGDDDDAAGDDDDDATADDDDSGGGDDDDVTGDGDGDDDDDGGLRGRAGDCTCGSMTGAGGGPARATGAAVVLAVLGLVRRRRARVG